QKYYVGNMTVAPNGKILVYYWNIQAQQKIHVARYNANGAPDRSFGGDGDVSISIAKSFVARSLAVLNNGKILLGGENLSSGPGAAIFRLNANGTLDDSFGTGGLAFASGSQIMDLDLRRSDNHIVAAGESGTDWKVWVLDPTGPE